MLNRLRGRSSSLSSVSNLSPVGTGTPVPPSIPAPATMSTVNPSHEGPPHKLCMIPGPVEFDATVLGTLATPATSHVDPSFINTFGEALELLRQVFMAPNGQPFIVAGSGTLTWDMTAANLVEPDEHVLVISTGVFGDWFAECFEVYGAKLTHISAAFGDRPSLDEIEKALSKKSFKLISITHVDTSSGVLNDIEAIAKLVHRVSPRTLIAVDGVCSVGGELIRQEEWGIDVVMTASQKAIGVPPGLALMVVSQRAMEVALTRVAPPTTYFGSFLRWLPIMKKYEARQPSYFATPPVQLIMALNVSLKQLVQESLVPRFERHHHVSDRFKNTLESWGLKLVPVERSLAANTLTAVYYPDGISGPDFLKAVSSSDVLIAGGLHPLHNTKYFRVGHMHISAVYLENGHIERTLSAIENALKEVGYTFPQTA